MVAVAASAMSFWDGPDSMAFTPFLKCSDGSLALGKSKLTRALSAQTLEPLAFKPVIALDFNSRAGLSSPSRRQRARQAPASLPPLKREVVSDLKQPANGFSAMQEDLLGIPALRVPTPAASGLSRSRSAAALLLSSSKGVKSISSVSEASQQAPQQPQLEEKTNTEQITAEAQKVEKAEEEATPAQAVSTKPASEEAMISDEPAFRRVRPGELLIIVDELDEMEFFENGRLGHQEWAEETSEEELWADPGHVFSDDSFFDMEEEEV